MSVGLRACMCGCVHVFVLACMSVCFCSLMCVMHAFLCVYMRVCVFACMPFVCVHACKSMNVALCVCMCAYLRVSMYLCLLTLNLWLSPGRDDWSEGVTGRRLLGTTALPECSRARLLPLEDTEGSAQGTHTSRLH